MNPTPEERIRFERLDIEECYHIDCWRCNTDEYVPEVGEGDAKHHFDQKGWRMANGLQTCPDCSAAD